MKFGIHNSKMRVMAVASGGGHWEQLMLVKDAFSSCEVHFVTTMSGLLDRDKIENGYIVEDCNRKNVVSILKCLIQCLKLMVKIRPHVVVSTGAAPGLICLFLGRAICARTIWIDSIANAERLSFSGTIASRFAHVCLTQWKHLAKQNGPHYVGAVL